MMMNKTTDTTDTSEIPTIPHENALQRAWHRTQSYYHTVGNDILLLVSEHPWINLLTFLIGEFFVILVPILPQLLIQTILLSLLVFTPWILLLVKEGFHKPVDITSITLPFLNLVFGILIGFLLMLIAINLY